MPVIGGREAVQKFRVIPVQVRQSVIDLMPEASGLVLQDMQNFTPRDAANPGSHAADGLTIEYEKDGLRARIGLPSYELESKYFWFRFLDGGTAGGEVTYSKNGKRFTMSVPARPALRIRERAKDGNIAEVERMVRQAIAEGLRQA